ncbi:hypothetical protein ZIOFF_060545 [Zingiber officinale]|uniref:Uncharacterized protein n=1 Tax=Zingiber officinale TaxID=94328 RepID=A0A8J5FGV2_ZINOF|nr:hypothetical protein ZIOFF_060545 [Zingiber officinale]
MSKGQSQTRIQSGRRALGKCKSKTIETIEIEKGKTNVVIIDASESSHQDSDHPKAKTNEIPSVVIHIDDEEGEIDKLQSNADQHSSNSRVCPVFDSYSTQQELDDEECVMYSKEDLFSSSYSSRKGFPNLSTFSTSGSDDSDLEVEDISGHIHEQWERAALKRKMSQTVRMRSDDQSSVSGLSVDPCFSSSEPTQNMVDLEDCRIKSYFEHSNIHCNNMGFSEHFKHTRNVDNLEDCTNKHFHYFEASPSMCGPSHSSCEVPSFGKNTSASEGGLLRSQIFETHIDLNKAFTPVSESGHLRSQIFETHIDPNETFTPDLQMQGNTSVNIDGCCIEKAEKGSSGNCSSTSTLRVETNSEGKEEPTAGKPSHSLDSSCNHSEKEYDLSTQSQHGNSVHQEINPGAKEKSFVEQTPAFNDPLHDEPINQYSNESFDCETKVIHGESTSINDAENEASRWNFSLHVQSTTAAISEREKHKESDEYKRAAEEEWAQRKLEIQSQAEEAQRLRKRRKAESLRLLDMEKRQKQRVEEIRESRRKNEQMVHLKEELRADVRKELDEMEWRYRDMASLLRGLLREELEELYLLVHFILDLYHPIPTICTNDKSKDGG